MREASQCYSLSIVGEFDYPQCCFPSSVWTSKEASGTANPETVSLYSHLPSSAKRSFSLKKKKYEDPYVAALNNYMIWFDAFISPWIFGILVKTQGKEQIFSLLSQRKNLKCLFCLFSLSHLCCLIDLFVCDWRSIFPLRTQQVVSKRVIQSQ